MWEVLRPFNQDKTWCRQIVIWKVVGAVPKGPDVARSQDYTLCLLWSCLSELCQLISNIPSVLGGQSEAQPAPGGNSHGHKFKKSQKHDENMAFPIIYLVNKLAAIAGRKKDNVKSVYKIKKTKVKRNLSKVHS